MSASATSADDEADAAEQFEPWADVGLVVVHGIGEQARGATLLDWAEPITRRLDEITAGVEVVRSQLVDEGRSEVRLLVRTRDGRELRVIVREARWADAFLTVRSSDVLAWGRRFSLRALRRLFIHLRRLASMVIELTTGRTDSIAAVVQTIEDRVAKWLPVLGAQHVLTALVLLLGFLHAGVVLVGGIGLALLFGPLALVMITVGTLVLAALAKVPVLGKRVHAVLAGLVLTVGDAATWTERPLRAAAMRDRVRDAISDVDARQVVVLGHSQGAAVAVEAVLGPGAPAAGRVASIVTVGGAVSLLRRPTWSNSSHDDTPGVVARWSARSELGWSNIWATWDPVPSGPVGDDDEDATQRWLGMYEAEHQRIEAEGKTLQRAVQGKPSVPRAPRPWPGAPLPQTEPKLSTRALLVQALGLASPAQTVQDFALSPRTLESIHLAEDPKDLASLGTGNRIDPNDSRAATVPGPAEIAVHNRASILADHTTYTSNVRQVIDPLARLLVTLGGRDGALPPRDTDAAERHVDAVRMLGAMRISALVASVVGLVALASRGFEMPIFDWLLRAVRPVSAGSARACRGCWSSPGRATPSS